MVMSRWCNVFGHKVERYDSEGREVCSRCNDNVPKQHGPDNPVSEQYPQDGSCSYCGANNWSFDCGAQVCVECGEYD